MDPEGFGRGGTTLTFFLSSRGERGSKSTISGPASARQRNAIEIDLPMDIHVIIVISTEATNGRVFGYSGNVLSLTSFKSFLLENIL